MHKQNNQNMNWLPWALAAFFGAAFMMLLGMVVMYFLIGHAAPVEFAANDRASNSGPLSNIGHQSDEERLGDEKRLEKTDDLKESERAGSSSDATDVTARPQLPDLPDWNGELLVDQDPTFHYDWSEPLAYNFDLNMTVDQSKVRFNGRTSYEPTDDNPARFLEGAQSQRATGTGFVVHPQGLIMTCAHVVEGSEQVSVTIDGRITKASVVSLNHEHDLALLRIPKPDKGDLHHLAIASLESVNQGDDVRVLGFPLTDLLGSSIKITSGAITGFSDETNEVQIDATVNPGNSGGPVLDKAGRVVGVASSLLDGRGMSNVGLAVGVEHIRAFLKRSKMPFATESSYSAVDNLKKAVVFIERNGKRSTGGQQVVEYSSYFRPIVHFAGQSTKDKGTLVVDSRGVLSNESSKQASLPMTLQKLCQIGIEQLPITSARKTWSESEVIVVQRVERKTKPRIGMPGIPSGFPSGFGGLRGHPFMPGGNLVVSEKTHSTVATQTTQYEIVSDDKDELVVKKIFEVKPNVQSGRFRLSYSGEYRFDKTKNRISQGQFKGKTTADDGSSTVPFTFGFKFVTQEQIEAEIARRKASIEANRIKREKDAARLKELTVPALDAYDPSK